MNLTFSSPITSLHGVGPAFGQKLKKLGIETVRDLFFHLPTRYDDFTQILPIKKVQPDQAVTVEGVVKSISAKQIFGRPLVIVSALVEDSSGAIRATWFNQLQVATSLSKGTQVMLSGKAKVDKNGLYLANPSFETKDREKDTTHTARLVPIYPETHGISSRWLRWQIKSNLGLTHSLKDWLPAVIKQKYNLPDIDWILPQVHFPDSLAQAKRAKDSLSFRELFLLQLFLVWQKQNLTKVEAPSIPFKENVVKDFVKGLPFKLTTAQRKATYEILKDLEKPHPMHRLLEGDVGSGKTVVSAIAALSVVEAGWRVVIMAPTEILAEQHFGEFKKLLPNQKISLLTGKQKDDLSADIIIGTHALLYAKLERIGLSIIDEQHRFGTNQRARLTHTHLLSMTATPIPRTLALTIYGDLDLSIIDEMPQGRKNIMTRVVAPSNRHQAYSLVKSEIKKGRQAFVICPLVEESKILQTRAVKKEYKKLADDIFPEFKVDYIHGRHKQKQAVMERFVQGKTDILVSTSVVEVGIDVKNATIMMIEGAERFGLAQLYQLRGRVGRGREQSYCFIFTDSSGAIARQRLKAIEKAKSGFELAEADLKIRGPGQFLGLRQSGLPDVAMESLLDAKLIKQTKQAAESILSKIDHYPILKKKLDSFQNKVHLE